MLNRSSIGVVYKRRALVWPTAIGLLALSGSARGFQFDTGNPDVEARWDNSIRYNLGVRAQSPSGVILNDINQDNSDSKFKQGNIVTNRVDVLSEFDLSYQKRAGLRLSGALWYDDAYRDTSVKSNPAFVSGPFDASSPYANNQYTDYVKRWNRGPSGELLDAFVFTKFDVGEVPVNIKFGQHNIYWGESLFSFIHGVSYSQGPVDIRKAYANPGTEAKELFKPLTQLSASAQLTDELTVAGQYFLDWKASAIPDGGTYFGISDFITAGGGTYVINPVAAAGASAQFGTTVNPVPWVGSYNKPKTIGDWGLMTKWSPKWLDGSAGLYLREYTDKLPSIVLGGLQPGLPVPSSLGFSYSDKRTRLLGVSLSKSIGGVSVGSELSYRYDGPLLMSSSTLRGQEPRGDTLHGLVNALASFGKTPVFDSATLIGELTYSRLMKVRANSQNFNSVDYGIPGVVCQGVPGSTNAGCATKDAWGLSLLFKPTWYQVFPGVDMSMPSVLMVGLKGNSPVLFGGYQGYGSYSIGLSAEVKNQYTATLAYNGYLAKHASTLNAQGNVVTNGIGALWDRGWVSLTLKATF